VYFSIKGHIAKFVVTVAAVFILLLIGGCDPSQESFLPLNPQNSELIRKYYKAPNGTLYMYQWVKEPGFVDEETVWQILPDGSHQQLSPDEATANIQPLGAQTVSTRPDGSGSSARRSLSFNALGWRVNVTQRASSAPSTSAYILDAINLFQLDPATGNVLRTLNLTTGLPGLPSRFAITSDGAFAVISNQAEPNQPYVLIVDLASFTIVANIPIPEKAAAYGIALTPDNKFAYMVTLSLATVQNSIYVLDLNARKIVTTIPLPKYDNLQNIVITPDGTEAYLNSGVGGDIQIPVIDITTNTVALDVPTYFYSTGTGIVYYGVPAYMAMHPDGTRVYLAPIDGSPIYVLDTATKMVTHLITLPQKSTSPYGTAPVFTPDGRFMFVLDSPGALSMIDTRADTFFTSLPLDPTIAAAPPGGVKVGFYFVPGP
jgi:DNA-binding beta-propeller fold protein YncE